MSYPTDPRRLLEIIDKLEKRIVDLECEAPVYYPVDPNREKYNLSEKMAKLFSLLKYEKAVELDTLCGRMGTDSREAVKMNLYHLRKKLLRHGIGIVNRRNLGYYLIKVDPDTVHLPLSDQAQKLFNLLSYKKHSTIEQLVVAYRAKNRTGIHNRIYSLRAHLQNQGITIDHVQDKGYILRKMTKLEIEDFFRPSLKQAGRPRREVANF